MLAADAREAGGIAPAEGVRLLPAFDQYVVAATKQAEHFLGGDHAPASTARRAGCRRCCSSTG